MSSRLFTIICIFFAILCGCEDTSIVIGGANGGKSSTHESKSDKDNDKDSQDELEGDTSEKDSPTGDESLDGGDNGDIHSDDGQEDPDNSSGEEGNGVYELVGKPVEILESIACDPSDIRDIICEDNLVIKCVDHNYYYTEDCSKNSEHPACVDGFGCSSCSAGDVYCQDNDVYECSADGSHYALVKSCTLGKCVDGECYDDNCPQNAQFIYLVDTSYRLIKFNPGDKTGNYLTPLFKLNCSRGISSSTPFSMAVDREANAWVLYNDSSLYKVNIATEQCEFVTRYLTNGSGLSTFGMAFSLDEVGGTTDTLFIGDTATGGRFGRINTANMSYTPLALFPFNYENTPELTGTGLAKLFAFSPGENQQHISEIDKGSGNVAIDYQLPGAGGNVNAWAFAHWGGYFFTFETVGGVNKIYRYNIKQNKFEVFLDDTPYEVVGAGVSTCAPTEEVN